MQVLVALARAQGAVVSRDALIESCWDGRIVGEDAINRCMGRLRKLAQVSGNAFSIETVSRIGYRLKIAESATVVSSPGPGPLPAPTQPRVSAGKSPSTLRGTGVALAGGAAFAIVAIVIGGWWLWPRQAGAPPEPVASIAVLPFTNLSGDPAKEYFSDGFSEELLNDLSRAGMAIRRPSRGRFTCVTSWKAACAKPAIAFG